MEQSTGRRALIGAVGVICAAAISACGETDEGGSDDPNANGAAASSSDLGGASGGASTIGEAHTGGTATVGGGGTAGSTIATGGSIATGGVSATGGTNTTGGVSATGGTNATGGADSTGGTSATGGTNTTGGVSATGGTSATGGAMSTGGAGTSTGGAGTSTGGAGTGTGGAGTGTGGAGTGTGGMGAGTGGNTATPVAPSELIGWAATENCGPNGTTGGGDGPATVVVTTTAELEAALLAEGPAVIEVQGQMQGVRVKESNTARDKTLIGTGGAFISGGFRIDGGNNLIFKNIRFGEAQVVDGDDNLADGFTVHNTTCVWIDHCEFMNSIDGNLDLVGGDGAMTSWVTVSWSKFWYEDEYAAQTNPDHRLSNLIVGSDDRPDPLPYITYHHNWWAENVTERMPRGRWAWAHVFNNYYSTQGNNYGIGASVGIQFVVENNFFEPGFEDPVYFFNQDQGVAVRLSGNQMDGVQWVDTEPEEASVGTAFVPSDYYSYTLQTAEEAKASVIAGAGVQ